MSKLCTIAFVALILLNLKITKVTAVLHLRARHRRHCFLDLCTKKLGALWPVTCCWSCPAGHLSRSTRLRNANALHPLGVRERKVEGRGELRLFALHSRL